MKSTWSRHLVLFLGLVALTGAAAPLHAESDSPSGPKAVAEGLESASPSELRAKAYGHLMRALFAARKGDYRTVSDEIDLALQYQPESIEVHIQSAEMLSWIGRRSEAEVHARNALEIAPEDPQALGFLAELLAAQGGGGRNGSVRARREALRVYEKLREIAKLDDRQLRQLASLRWMENDQEGALEVAQELLEERPGDAAAAQLVFTMLMSRGDSGEALRLYLRYLAKHPNDLRFLDEARELTETLSAWSQVVEVLHDNPDLHNRATATHGFLGEALLRMSMPREAADALERGLLHDSSDPAVRYNATLAYRAVGRLADASKLVRELAAELPANGTVQRILGETLEQQRDVDGALNAYAAALRILSIEQQDEALEERDRLRLRMAGLHLDRDEQDPAQGFFEALEDRETFASLRLEIELARNADDAERQRVLAQQLREREEVAAAARIEGDLLLNEGKAKKAESKYREAIANGDERMRVGIAAAYKEAGLESEGLQWLEEWSEAMPRNADVSFQYGAYLYEMGRFDEAERALRLTIELNPQHAPALNYLGYGLAERGERLDEALALVERALAVDPHNGAYLDSLGWIYFRQGKLELAREPLELAAREFPFDPTILDHLGDLYQRVGESELALTAWQRALENDPDAAGAIEQKIASLSATGDDRSR